jgi:hypothetical protein
MYNAGRYGATYGVKVIELNKAPPLAANPMACKLYS